MRKIIPKTDKYRTGGMDVPMREGQSKPIYPTMRIDLEHIPEAKKWDLGEKYMVHVEVKLTGLSQSRFDNSAEFEIHKIDTGTVKKEKKEEEEK